MRDNRVSGRSKYYEVGPLAVDLSETAHLVSGRVLDIGGGGEGVIAQAFGGAAQVIAIDTREDELVEAKGHSVRMVMDATALQFLPGQFDVVSSFFSMLYIHAENKYRVFQDAFRVLKPGGRFLIWDAVLDNDALKSSLEAFVAKVKIRLPSLAEIAAGYGVALGESAVQSSDLLNDLARRAGFRSERDDSKPPLIVCSFLKP